MRIRAQVYTSLLCVMLMLIALSFSGFTPGYFERQSAFASSSATVSVSPSTVKAFVGQNFSINVTISGVSDLYGWQFRLNWTAGLIDIVNVAEGPFLKHGGGTYFYYDVNSTAGRLVVDCTLLGNVPGVSGDGTLATITFNVKGVGESPLTLWDVILLNSLEQTIPSHASSGYGYFMAAHNVAVTAVNVQPLTVLPGETVYINVSVQNRGGWAESFNVTVYANSIVVGVQHISLDANSLAVLQFSWSTSGLGKGDYTISASASVVPGEVNTADNSFVAGEPVTILFQGHDVAVIGVSPSKTVVGEGYTMNITVRVKNYGTFNEVFNVTGYANTTAMDAREISLTSGASATLTFTWNTSGFAKGNYTISAYAWPVDGEVDVSNNLMSETVALTIPGDINGDGSVNLQDLVLLANAYGSSIGTAKWNANADINGSLTVDLSDLVILAKNYGRKI